jgi:plastocyanin
MMLLSPLALRCLRSTCAQSSHMPMIVVAALAVSATLAPASAGQAQEISVAIKDHKFEPAEIRVPAAKAITLKVRNLDESAEEFESKALGVEKVIAGGGIATIRLKPLSHGRYPFVGEFHEDIAKGVIIAE